MDTALVNISDKSIRRTVRVDIESPTGIARDVVPKRSAEISGLMLFRHGDIRDKPFKQNGL